jgi:hypothetical protein
MAVPRVVNESKSALFKLTFGEKLYVLMTYCQPVAAAYPDFEGAGVGNITLPFGTAKSGAVFSTEKTV